MSRWTFGRWAKRLRARTLRSNHPHRLCAVASFSTRLEDRILPAAVTTPVDFDAAPNSVPELAANGTTVGVTAFASDADFFDTVTYSLADDAGGRFAIDPTSGVVTVARGDLLDFETAPTQSIIVQAQSSDGSTSTQSFTINITDANDPVGPVTDADPAPNSVPENSPNGTTVGITALAIDPDAANNAVAYSLIADAGGRFAINPTTGVVTVAKSEWLDREAAAAWSITVQATSQDGTSSVKAFTINLTDVNDNAVSAISDGNPAANIVAENSANGTLVGITAVATDPDATNNVVTYSLTANAGGRFKIDPNTGVVSVANGSLLDREQAAAWSITVQATSQDGSSSVKAFTINLADVDEFDVGPITDTNSKPDTVVENSKAGTLVGLTAHAVDADATNNTVTYSLTDNAGGLFAINPTTGVVSVATGAVIDYEAATSHSITIQAASADGSVTNQTYVIQVTNVNDDPRVTLSKNTVAENSAVGTAVGNLGTNDLKVTSPVYTLVSGTGGTDNKQFTISGSQLRTNATFDFEKKSTYSIRVQVTGNGVRHTTVLTINVTNVNEAPTGLSLSQISVPENKPAGTVVGTLKGLDPDVGDTLNYSLVSGTGSTDNAQFKIVGNQLETNASFDYETKKTYSIRVQVRDAAGLSYQTSFTINVLDGPG